MLGLHSREAIKRVLSNILLEEASPASEAGGAEAGAASVLANFSRTPAAVIE